MRNLCLIMDIEKLIKENLGELHNPDYGSIIRDILVKDCIMLIPAENFYIIGSLNTYNLNSQHFPMCKCGNMDCRYINIDDVLSDLKKLDSVNKIICSVSKGGQDDKYVHIFIYKKKTINIKNTYNLLSDHIIDLNYFTKEYIDKFINNCESGFFIKKYPNWTENDIYIFKSISKIEDDIKEEYKKRPFNKKQGLVWNLTDYINDNFLRFKED